MDPDGDGVDADELMKFIKEQHAELSGRQASRLWGIRVEFKYDQCDSGSILTNEDRFAISNLPLFGQTLWTP